MKTKNLIIGLLSILITSHLIFDVYFYQHYLSNLEDQTSHDYANHYSIVVKSWQGNGERLVNEINHKRSRTFQKVYCNDSFANSDSLICFQDFNNREGFINANTMRIAIQPKFSFVTEFSDGLSLAIFDSSKTKYGFIDRNGNWKIRPRYESRYIFNDDDTTYYRPHFYKGYCYIKIENSKYVIINKNGKIVSKRPYNQIRHLGKGFRMVSDGENKFGLIDSCFIEVIPTLYTKKELFKLMSKKNIIFYKKRSGKPVS